VTEIITLQNICGNHTVKTSFIVTL